jgi:hypothetical protein
MKRLLFMIAILIVSGALVWAFMASRKEAAQEAERERPVKAPSRVSVANGAQVITLDAEAQRRSGIETAQAAAAEYRDELRAYGAVLELGRLTDLFNSYAAAKAQLQTAQAKLAASKTAFERSSVLYKDDQNVSLARLQAVEAAFRSDAASVAAAEAQAQTLAATAEQEWGPVLGKSLVERAPLIARLIERRDVLLQVTLTPGAALPHAPARAAVQTGREARAPLTLVSPAPRTDPKIQGRSFFYIASAESGLLPGMNVLAYLPSGEAVDGAVVPGAAIVWWQDRAWIYRRTSPETFMRAQIGTEQPAASGGYVVKDLPMGSEIVTRGAQLLLSEEFRAQIRIED